MESKESVVSVKALASLTSLTSPGEWKVREAVNVIPQSPPIKVRVIERSDEGKTLGDRIGRIVAWRVDYDADLFDQLTPVIWSSGYAHAIPYDDPNTEVRYIDEWD